VPAAVVVVDNHSTDGTEQIARELADVVIIAGPERSAQRNVGTGAADSAVVGFIDSDMILEPGVVEDAVAEIRGGAAAVFVPERTTGSGFWAQVRAFERSFYAAEDDSGVAAARFFPRAVFNDLGGYDTRLTGAEDWDLSLRAARRGRVARTTSCIHHDESGVTYRGLLAKRAYYARGYGAFLSKHGSHALRMAADRPYLREPWRLVAPHPVLGIGVLALKAGEAAVITATLTRHRIERWAGSATGSP
jgi:arabinofuranan 3-O-arabinosyltransferase